MMAEKAFITNSLCCLILSSIEAETIRVRLI